MKKENNIPVKFRSVYFQVLVKDLERAKSFYEDVFDFEVAFYKGPELGWCEFHLPTTTARLGLNASRQEEELQKNSGVLTLDVENLEESKKYFESKGIKTTDIIDNPNNISFFNLEDSEGNKIQIVGDPRIQN